MNMYPSMMFFWVLAPCGFMDTCQRFGETVSIFWVDVVLMLGTGGFYTWLKEEKVEGAYESTRRQNPK
jgi:hypothetical protein